MARSYKQGIELNADAEQYLNSNFVLIRLTMPFYVFA